MVNVLRDNDGNPLLTNCFQGSKRFERQCGPLRHCCSAYNRCKKLVKQSFITKQKQILIHEIQFAAKECKESTYQLNNATESINEATISENSSTLITFTNEPDKDELLESYLRYSPSQWYTFLKNILLKETQNTSIFRINNTTQYYGPKTDKNDNYYQMLPNTTNEIEKWNNAEQKNDTEEYQIGKKQEMHPNHTEVEKTMDRCQIVWNSVNRIPLLSTATLLEMGDRCVNRGDNNFTELYKLTIERDSELHGCLKMYQDETNELATCRDINRIHWQWNSDILQNITSNADCLAQVNLVQFECAELNKCCPNFHRCRDETLDAKSELRIELLTVKLITNYYECIRHQLITMTTF
ncbi:unnamed protein product [Wuchereria bancrofti]|uniref:Uncharacterized protein n=1 Tax=Wuchereria bancrofti TaxID=6293 RepID=A0A3P7EFI1_WUCBA|nr:unnamed protein product [Wuchereria bancrofti]